MINPTEATREGAIMLLDMCALDANDRRLILVHEDCERGVIDARNITPGAVLSLALDARQRAARALGIYHCATPNLPRSDAERYRLSCGEAAAMLRNREHIER